jgi:probable phosphoglycerate mutase
MISWKGEGPTTIFIDGGSRGNPGPAGYGVVIKNPEEEILHHFSGYLGVHTNNVAEYSGLLAALEFALQKKLHHVRILSDSELLVRQMKGHYRVKSPGLQPLHQRAKEMAAQIPRFEIEHIRRELNREADALANEAMDCAPSGESQSDIIHFQAIVEGGRLRPITRVSLPEREVVECTLRLRK